MAELCYPVFEEGQTLTRDDLELLRDFFDERVRQVGRAVGFGIGCGLDGHISRLSGLVIEAGRAVDQHGEVLVLDTDVHFELPPEPGTMTFDFIADDEKAGYTAVLVKHEVETAGPECGQEGCEGHAGTTCRSAEIVWVPGRLSVAHFEFAREPLIVGFAPLPAGAPATAFVSLRSGIVERLHGMISAEAEAKLAALALVEGELPAIANHKIGFLNQILFAALDLLRCQALLDIACVRPTKTPGVALGWLRGSGTRWIWDCEFRHAWEPPPGLSIALVGGACDDACGLHRRRLESMIAAYEPPIPAAGGGGGTGGGGGVGPGGGGTGGGGVGPSGGGGGTGGGGGGTGGGGGGVHWPPIWPHCGDPRDTVVDSGMSKVEVVQSCSAPLDPPDDVPGGWFRAFLDTGGPTWPPRVTPTEPWKVYGTPEPDWMDQGLIVVTEAYGHTSERIMPSLVAAIENAGGVASVKVVNEDEAAKLTGFARAGAISPADTFVLVIDAQGTITETGRIPVQVEVQSVAGVVPAVAATATDALTTAKGVEKAVGAQTKLIESHAELLGAVNGQLGALTKFRTDAGATLSGLDGRIAQKANEVLGSYQGTIGPLLSGALLDASSKLEGRLDRDIEARADKVVAPLREQIAELNARAELVAQAASGANTRIDQVLGGRVPAIGVDIGRETTFNESMVGFLHTVRTAVEAGATARQRPKVQAELAKGQEALERLESSVRAGALVLRDEREALTAVLESVVGALGAAGSPAKQVDQIRAQVADLQEQLR
jgi:hypothetical protein